MDSSSCQDLSINISIKMGNETGKDCTGSYVSGATGPIKIQPKMELNAVGNDLSTVILCLSTIDGNKSVTKKKSIGDQFKIMSLRELNLHNDRYWPTKVDSV